MLGKRIFFILLVLASTLALSSAEDAEEAAPEEAVADEAAPEEAEAAEEAAADEPEDVAAEEDEPEKPPPNATDEISCVIEEMPTDANFNDEKFLGSWYVVSDTGLFPLQRTFDKIFYMVQDMKLHIAEQEDGELKLIMSVRTPIGCSVQVGRLDTPDEDEEPARMTASYPGSWFPALRNPSPFWVIGTDYDSWALVYSCRKTEDSGHCDPKHTVAWVMSRSAEGLTDIQKQEVHEFTDTFCLEYEDFSEMPRSKTCPDIKPEDYPDLEAKAEL